MLLTQHGGCHDGDVLGCGERLRHGEGNLDARSNADADKDLVAQILGRIGIGLQCVKQASTDSDESSSRQEEQQIVLDPREQMTTRHGKKSC